MKSAIDVMFCALASRTTRSSSGQPRPISRIGPM
jgi:hypothetical protein